MQDSFMVRLRKKILRFRDTQSSNRRIWRLNQQVTRKSPKRPLIQSPVAFFNASSRLEGISQNAAFSLVTTFGMQMAGVPVVNFACKAGMSQCVLGTVYPDLSGRPPCRKCIVQSRWLFSNAPTIPFTYRSDPSLAAALQNLGVDELSKFEYRILDFEMPLGPLALPSVRWALRRHNLPDDEPTRALYRDYLQSAYGIGREFNAFLDAVNPQTLVVFNGMFFPEATARRVAQRRGLRVISHEVGLRPYSAFFTEGEATAYPIQIPDSFQLSDEQNTCLDEYLSQRFQGNFTMAGVRFWPEMSKLDEGFLRQAAQFRQIVPVFTNVIFDTSQPHSNTVFPHMFAWLEVVLDLARRHPETLFVLRAHPDEARPGKSSRESVRQWVEQNRAINLPNVIFVDTQEFISSYELIRRSKFVMVYNSTIGLEASILGAAVLCGGKARFTQLPTVFFPVTMAGYRQQAEDFLAAADVATPPEFQCNARRFLYYQLYKTSLPFDEFIEADSVWPGFVTLRRFSTQKLSAAHSPTIRVLVDGIVHGKEFVL
jgi:hypothetical protein